MLFHPANLPYWILLGVGISLFLLVIVTGGGEDDFDFDSDMDLDVDADANGALGNFGPMQILSLLGLGRVPLILLIAIDLSLWGLTGWTLNAIFGVPGGWLASAVFIGSLAIALVGGRLLSQPVGYLFASFSEDTSRDRLIGCIGTVTSATIESKKLGQIDVLDNNRNLVTVTAALPEWATVIPQRGDKAIVIDRTDECYIVIADRSVDCERWLGEFSRDR